MRNKFIMVLGLIIAALIASIGLTTPASATGNHGPEVSGKPVTVCHATGSESNPYVKLMNVPLVQFIDPNGHGDHEGDIWAAFSYVERTGSETWKTVNVAAHGDTSLLEFDKCKAPKTDEQIALPEVVYNDECGTSNDTFSVAPGRGYTVGALVKDNNLSITATLLEGFVLPDGGHSVTFIRPVFTDVDCDLPDTGAPQTATMAGWGALGGVSLLAVVMVLMHRRRLDG